MSRGSSYQRAFFERGYNYDDDDTMYAAPMRNGTSLDDFDDTEGRDDSGSYSSSRGAYQKSFSSAKPHRRSNFTDQFQEEWNTLKSIALGTLMGTLRSMVREHMPSVAPKLEQAINSASAKLGTEPIDVSATQPHNQGPNGRSQAHQTGTSESRGANTSSSQTKPNDWQGMPAGMSSSSTRGQYR
jgi:hypothetical protein